MKNFIQPSRRYFLRGLGVAVALPSLESARTTRVWAAISKPAPVGLGTTSSGAPLRMAFVYVPNGAIQPHWWPTGADRAFEFARTMQSLQPVKSHVQILRGLDHANATAGPDGAGDHARASGTFLTGVRAKKTAGADIQAGISIDQVVANQVGHLTRFKSLEMTCDAVHKSGNCDSGYSCAYQYNLAWRSPSGPMTPELNPRLLFERLFGTGPHGQRHDSLVRRQQQRRSVLDFVSDDARALQGALQQKDRQKVDEYLGSLRDVEKRIQSAEAIEKTPDPDVPTPEGVPTGSQDYMRLMYDMLVLAFETDSTRVATLLIAGEGSNRTFPEIGIPEGHHNLTHHGNRQEAIDKVANIDRYYMAEFARFVTTLHNKRDIDGQTLLHNSMILYGSGNADGNRHTHDNLPLVLAGAGGGTLAPGRYVDVPSTPMSNLLLSLADRCGVKGVDSHGDSTGRLQGI